MLNFRKLIDKDYFCEYDLLVISPGGSSQTYIMDEIIKQKPNNYTINMSDDSDNLKHLSSFENSVFNCKKINRVLYIFNNTLLSILSNIRRKWYKMQYRKISKFEDFNNNYLFENQKDLFIEDQKINKDISNVSVHFYNWLKYPNNIFFLNVNDYDQNKLNNFLDFELKLEIKSNNRYLNYVIPNEICDFYDKIDKDIKLIIKNKELVI